MLLLDHTDYEYRKASPHIESRVKYLKQKYCAITEILSKTGVTWDDQRKIISCDKKWYDDWCKMHESAKGLWGMPFPHLDILAEIYGKDRATGEGVETFVDTMHNIENEEANPMLAYIEGGPNIGDDDNENETQSAERAVQVVQERLRNINPEMAEKSTTENNTARVVAELLALSFNSNQIIKATDIFAAEPSKMNVLFSLPQQLKRQYVLDVLNLSVGESKAGSTSKEL
uniref:Uncharacterized protein n=1 Tax=Ananas comosus var. bracteatus TaxID=296719 RepID=A0A6V7PRL1_ANACO|nr:unnamed protein product [Ananas comosus var. bracteatus]